MDSEEETYILLLLSDSNLPTGSFVASAGFESYVKHGFPIGTDSKSGDKITITFIQDSLETYARSALPFVSDSHRAVQEFRGYPKDSLNVNDETNKQKLLDTLAQLDQLYHVMTLNHVARRASASQGVALLSLFSKGLSHPPSLIATEAHQTNALSPIVDQFKTMIRREETEGHLPVCWGLLTAALGLSLERSQHLHLFLHARSLLSASVRLNAIGPYGAQQILLHAVRPLVAAETSRCKALKTCVLEDDLDMSSGPATTWPLGEILAGRHDLQHSRIFNS